MSCLSCVIATHIKHKYIISISHFTSKIKRKGSTELNKVIKLDAAVIASASAVGKLEYSGPLGSYFDIHDESEKFGEDSYEHAESSMQRAAMNTAIAKSGLSESDIDAIFAGDLMNQCTGSAFGMLGYEIPYFGLYGACSTAAEGLMLAAMAVSGGALNTVASIASSHYCTAERQYRSPLEYGSQRPPTAQWTVTGAGAFIVGREGRVTVTGALPGIVREMGVRDANNMGAAMAPAAPDTVLRYFDQCRDCELVDCIVTGDLGFEGSAILRDLIADKTISDKLTDCGQLIYDPNTQDVHSGGSGCGCSAAVMASYFIPRLWKRELRQVLFVGTGAMMSPMTVQQGDGIPAVAHLVRLES